MKKLIVFFFSISVFAQDYGNNAETLKLCTTLQTNSFSSNLDADTALDRILEVVGLSKNFVLAPCSDINNAVAVSFKGVRYILYDPDFMSMLSRNTSNWTNLFPESKIDERKRWLDKDIIEMLWRTYYFGDFEYLHKRFLYITTIIIVF